MREIKTLISKGQLQRRIKSLAKEIEKDYQGRELIILCVLKGASFFTIQLTQNMKTKIKLDFIELSSYGTAKESSGQVVLKKDIKESIEGKDVLVVEDIVDTGRTLSFLKEHLKTKRPNSVRICSLLDKPDRRVVPLEVDYVGFKIPNKFVLGFGLDYEEYYRNLPYIGYVEE